jgi:6-phosphogluconolactonase/glucosamine-6-phosphate isomerase/deaminase
MLPKQYHTVSSYLKENSDKQILLLLSGGSALKILDYIDASTLSSNLTITVLDERYSTDPNINNFAQLMDLDFYKKAKEKGCHFIDTQIQNGENQEQHAERFDQELKNWRNQNPTGKIISTQGMGPDGHTSGIMPFPEKTELFEKLFNDSQKWVVAYDASRKNPSALRVTTTLSFLREMDVTIFYVTGESKKTVLQEVLQPGSVAEYPARIIHEMKKVLLFTDVQDLH